MPALQLELTKTPKQPNQTCAALKMLEHLHSIGFRFKQVSNKVVDADAPPVGEWATTPGPWDSLPGFPSSDAWKRIPSRTVLSRDAQGARATPMTCAPPPTRAPESARPRRTLALDGQGALDGDSFEPPRAPLTQSALLRMAAHHPPPRTQVCLPARFWKLLDQPDRDEGYWLVVLRQRRSVPCVAVPHLWFVINIKIVAGLRRTDAQCRSDDRCRGAQRALRGARA